MKQILLALAALCFANVAHAQIINSLPYTFSNGTVADATQVNSNFSQIVNNANANAAKNGVNSDITALTALITPISPVAGGSTAFIGTVGGTANAITVAVTTPNNFTLTSGYRAFVKATGTNTGAATLAVGGTAATAINRMTSGGLVALTGGEIVNGNTYELSYNGSVWVLLNGGQQLLGKTVNVASASTTDLGAAQTHNIIVTGTTTIAGFGSTASVNEPIYFLTFSGALTLTYNATSMVLPGAANITTAANDTAIAAYLGSGNWQIVFYQRNSGTPSSGINLQTAVASTSGTTIDFTGIPPTAKRITVMFSGVSTNGTSNMQVQLLVSGTPETSGYNCIFSGISGTNTATTVITTGFGIGGFVANTDTFYGQFVLNNLTGNTWTASGTIYAKRAADGQQTTAGSKALAGVLNGVRITTVNGTDTFDAGTINVSWE